MCFACVGVRCVGGRRAGSERERRCVGRALPSSCPSGRRTKGKRETEAGREAERERELLKRGEVVCACVCVYTRASAGT